MSSTHLPITLLVLLGVASAQTAGTQDTKIPRQKKVERVIDQSAQTGQSAGVTTDVAGESGGPLDDNALGRIGTPIQVSVKQEPYRFSPGQAGTLVLAVRIGPGANVRSGVAKYSRTQGPFELGDAVWDPPGKSGVYTDVFLIRIPVSVKPGTKFGMHTVTGSLDVRGNFSPVELPGPAGDPAGQARPATDGRYAHAVPGFAGTLKVGRPIPPMPDLKALTSRRETGNAAEKPADRSGSQRAADESPSAPDSTQVPKRVLAAESDTARSPAKGRPETSDDTMIGIYLLAAALLGALGLLFLRRR